MGLRSSANLIPQRIKNTSINRKKKSKKRTKKSRFISSTDGVMCDVGAHGPTCCQLSFRNQLPNDNMSICIDPLEGRKARPERRRTAQPALCFVADGKNSAAHVQCATGSFVACPIPDGLGPGVLRPSGAPGGQYVHPTERSTTQVRSKGSTEGGRQGFN